MQDETLAHYRVRSIEGQHNVNEFGFRTGMRIGADIAQITDVSDRRETPGVVYALRVPVRAGRHTVTTTTIPFFVNVESVLALGNSLETRDDMNSTWDLGEGNYTGRVVTGCGRHMGHGMAHHFCISSPPTLLATTAEADD